MSAQSCSSREPGRALRGTSVGGNLECILLPRQILDPNTGRLLSEDPSVFEGGMNFYPYVDNNAINYFDPLGLQKRNSRKKPKPPVGPCPKEKRCFFNWLDGPLGNPTRLQAE